jgi:hypothetical protein
MDKENVVHMHTEVSFNYRRELIYVVYRKMGGTEDHDAKQNKLYSHGKCHISYHIWNLGRRGEEERESKR